MSITDNSGWAEVERKAREFEGGKAKREYRAGFESGRLHDESDPLCRENIRKMEHALKVYGEFDLVRCYWVGYKDGLLTIHP